MTLDCNQAADKAVETVNADGASSVVLVCEHASHYIPPEYAGLRLSQGDAKSHAAWDPGALGVATHLSKRLDATLVAGRVSRLVYDCNRPPEADDAMPARSELIDVPGNRALSAEDRAQRVEKIYWPFRTELERVIASTTDPVIVTVHSFTPIYNGKQRSVEIGILHDRDTRLADAMLAVAVAHTSLRVMRNEPYGSDDGVTHTLQEQGLKHGHLNVMLEIRNDLIGTPETQEKIGDMIADWLQAALGQLSEPKAKSC